MMQQLMHDDETLPFVKRLAERVNALPKLDFRKIWMTKFLEEQGKHAFTELAAVLQEIDQDPRRMITASACFERLIHDRGATVRDFRGLCLHVLALKRLSNP
jgi:hypothetical protein